MRGVLSWGVFSVELRGMFNWRFFLCGTDGCVELRDFGVELRGFWCWTVEFWVLKTRFREIYAHDFKNCDRSIQIFVLKFLALQVI